MADKQIQVPEKLFTMMAAFVLMDEYRTEQNCNEIKKGIYDKLDRMQAHDLYSKYKCAPTEEQKEKARQEYLERKGIHPSHRW